MFLLVEFTDTKEVAVIPNNWLDGNSCALWPTHIRMPSKLNAAVRDKTPPGESWPAYPIRELWKNESYNAVRRKLQQAEYETEVCTTAYSSESDVECRRSKRKKRPMQYSSDSEDEEMPLKRKAPKAPEPLPSPPGHFSSPSSLQPLSTDVEAVPPSPPGAVRHQPSSIRLGAPLTMPSQPTPSSSTSVARDLRLFTMMEKIHQKQVKLEETLNKVLTVVQTLTSGPAVDLAALPEDLALPITSFEEMDYMEEKLQEDAVLKALVNHLSVVGGANRADTTRRVMKHCLSHQMAVSYNWYGHKGKRAFGKLRLASAMQKAVMKSCRCTAAEVELDAREWLRTATDREGGRKKRAEKGH